MNTLRIVIVSVFLIILPAGCVTAIKNDISLSSQAFCSTIKHFRNSSNRFSDKIYYVLGSEYQTYIKIIDASIESHCFFDKQKQRAELEAVKNNTYEVTITCISLDRSRASYSIVFYKNSENAIAIKTVMVRINGQWRVESADIIAIS